MSNFRVGMRVVCIKPPTKGYTILPVTSAVVGNVYTVRAIINANGTNGLLLDEIVNPISPQWGVEYGHRTDRFRPLITPEQDIALFHTLCPGLPVVPPAVVPKRVTAPSHSD